jgi:hypothetical protein
MLIYLISEFPISKNLSRPGWSFVEARPGFAALLPGNRTAAGDAGTPDELLMSPSLLKPF